MGICSCRVQVSLIVTPPSELCHVTQYASMLMLSLALDLSECILSAASAQHVRVAFDAREWGSNLRAKSPRWKL